MVFAHGVHDEESGEQCLEFGFRLVPAARRLGFATEASLALLADLSEAFDDTIYGIIERTNTASINTITKLGFGFWKEAEIYGELRNLYRRGRYLLT